MSSSRSELAIRIAAAGLGAMAAGPFGGALGGLVSAALVGPAAELVKELASKFGESAAEKLFESGGDALADEIKPDSSMEAVYREALKRSLDALHHLSDGQYDDWFKNWSACLKADVSLSLPDLDTSQIVVAKLDGLLRSLLQQLDAQGAAIRGSTTLLFPAERELPEGLWSRLVDSLPHLVAENFSKLIVSDEYGPAWKEAQRRFERLIASSLVTIESGVAHLAAQQATDGKLLMEIHSLQLHLAQRDKRLDHSEAKALQAPNETERWTQDFLQVVTEQPTLESLLLEGDLEAAAKRKQDEIRLLKVREAKNYFDLGKIQELRFDWDQALDAYRRAWEIGNNIDHGYRYGLLAAKQNRHDEAEKTFEALCEVPNAGTVKAAALIELGRLYQLTGRPDSAESRFFEAKQVYAEIFPVLTEESKAYFAQVQASLGTLYQVALRRASEAEACFQLALEVYTQLAIRDPKTYLPTVAGLRMNLGNLFRQQGLSQEAGTEYEASIATFREAMKSDAKVNKPNLALALNNLSLFYRGTGSMPQAEGASRESITLYEELAKINPEAYDEDIATSTNNLAIVFSLTGRVEEAVSQYQRAVDIRSRLALSQPVVYQPLLAMTLNDIAAHYNRFGSPEEALELCSKAESMLRPLWVTNSRTHGNQMAKVLGLKSELWRQTGRSAAEACQFIREAITMAYEPALRKTIEAEISRYCENPPEDGS